MTEVSPHVFVSSLQESQDLENLKSLGITHVAVVAQEIECPHQHYLFHSKFDIQDHMGYDIIQHLGEIIEYISDRLDRGKNVLILGNAGNARAVAVAMAWIMKVDGMNFNRAWYHIQALIPTADPNSGFVTQLKRYEADLKAQDPNFGNTRTFPGSRGTERYHDRQPYEYTNHLDQTQGLDNTQRNPDGREAVNQFSESKGPHTDFWDVENATFKDKKSTFRYVEGHNNEYLGQVPVDQTHTTKYFTKNPGLIEPLNPQYNRHKAYQARQQLNDKYSKVGLERAQGHPSIADNDARRGHEVWRMTQNKLGRGIVERDYVNREVVEKRGEQLRITSFKNGNFGF